MRSQTAQDPAAVGQSQLPGHLPPLAQAVRDFLEGQRLFERETFGGNGIRDTAPYFHDNSAKTLKDVAEHYRQFFLIVSDPDGPGPAGPLIVLNEQDKTDIVAFLRLLD